MVLRHPLSKSKAITVSIIIGLIMMVIAFVEFDDIAVIGVLIGTLICHIVMRIGHAEYDAEIERIERQRAEAQHMFDEAADIQQEAEEKFKKANSSLPASLS